MKSVFESVPHKIVLNPSYFELKILHKFATLLYCPKSLIYEILRAITKLLVLFQYWNIINAFFVFLGCLSGLIFHFTFTFGVLLLLGANCKCRKPPVANPRGLYTDAACGLQLVSGNMIYLEYCGCLVLPLFVS